ncbi:MAG: SDR family NAD(P)-dependent oxidoreductase [Myxococcota bacterium]
MPKQIAVVTGGRRGLGLETCRRLARAGMHVVLTARSQDRAAEGAEALAKKGLTVTPEVLDVASDESVRALFERLRDPIAVLVNNAAAIFEDQSQGSFEVAPEVLLRAFDNNTLGAYRTMQYVLPRMNEAGFGRIVNVSSGMGALGDMGSGWPAYRISKTALHAVTRLGHNEARGDVKVNAVCPGWVRTDMGGASASRSVEEGAEGIVWAATLPKDGPSGGLFRDGTAVDW